MDYLREAIGVAGELRATLLVGPFYAHVAWFTGAPPTPDQFRWAVEGLRAVMPDLNRAGVGMAIEPMNRFERLFLPTAADGVRPCAAIGSERIGLTLDTAHMVIEEKDPIAALAAARPWLKHVQTSENDRGTPGTGCVIDWTGLFRTLRAIGYPGGCAIESYAFQDPEISSRTWCWRDLAPSPDVLAGDGLSFLRRTYEEAGQ